MIRGLRATLRPSRVSALAVALLGLAGCVTAPPARPPELSWPERRSALQTLERFEFRGRVAVAAGGEGFNGNLRWRQRDSAARLELDGPFGVGGVTVDADGDRLALETSRGEKLDAAAARAELDRRLGFSLPLASLRYWVLGVPDPASQASEVLGPTQRLERLEQNGWKIDYTNYVSAAGRWLPQRLTAVREDARVRLVVDRWMP